MKRSALLVPILLAVSSFESGAAVTFTVDAQPSGITFVFSGFIDVDTLPLASLANFNIAFADFDRIPSITGASMLAPGSLGMGAKQLGNAYYGAPREGYGSRVNMSFDSRWRIGDVVDGRFILSNPLGLTNEDFEGAVLNWGYNGDGIYGPALATLQSVPEPSAVLLGALAACGLLRRRR